MKYLPGPRIQRTYSGWSRAQADRITNPKKDAADLGLAIFGL
jgi:hypothetical protein